MAELKKKKHHQKTEKLVKKLTQFNDKDLFAGSTVSSENTFSFLFQTDESIMTN